ncbi:MAG: fluoride efflux transporter CrcB [Bacteroidales bacterium]|nr:fluoride efflux transporter CrcB [Bacteroidales bacterium]
MKNILFVALGGAIGSSLRYIISTTSLFLTGPLMIWRTFLVNIIGSLLIGFFIAFFLNSEGNNNFRIFLIFGILGGFTTFSSFAMESLNLLREGELKIAISYILATNILGILAAAIGFYFYKLLFESFFS